MDVGFEFIRTIVSTLSRRCTNYIVLRATSSQRLRRSVVALGQVTNTAYVRLKYFGSFGWTRSPTMLSPGKITLNVKPIDEDKAMELGADTMGELMVLVIMVSLVSIGLAIRKRKTNDATRLTQEKEAAIADRLSSVEEAVDALSQQVSQLASAQKRCEDCLFDAPSNSKTEEPPSSVAAENGNARNLPQG